MNRRTWPAALGEDAVAPARGWPGTGRGRAAHVERPLEYQATTVQACGLFPFVAGSGAPTAGVPLGRHQLWGEVVCCDPFAWMDAGPLGAVLPHLSGTAAERLRHEVRGRRLAAVLALCSLVRADGTVTNAEETVLGAAIDLLTTRSAVDPTVPDVLAVVRQAPERLVSAAEVDSAEEFLVESRRLRQTLRTLCE